MKLFLIAPHFPPSALPPSQRIRLMLPYMKVNDVEVTVFTVPHKYREEIADEWMLELAGSGQKVIEIKTISQKLTRFFGFGDLGLRLLPGLFFRLLKEIKTHRPDFILYPVPPWNTLLMVPLLYRLSGVKYGIDYIDPWIVRDKNKTFKQKVSQWLAIATEQKVLNKVSVIFAVSDGINQQLLKDYPFLKPEQFVTVPYGGEATDYLHFNKTINNKNYQLIRYVGGIGPDMPEVARAVLLAIKKVASRRALKAEFIGSSYAAAGMARPVLNKMVNEYRLQNIVAEQPERVSYKKAMELSMEADMLLLFGGMKTYYAASKLMGMLMSEKPLVAFVHRESFPSDFLKSIQFKYLITYTGEINDLPADHVEELSIVIENLLQDTNAYETVNIHNTDLKNYTAEAMTKKFIENIKRYV